MGSLIPINIVKSENEETKRKETVDNIERRTTRARSFIKQAYPIHFICRLILYNSTFISFAVLFYIIQPLNRHYMNNN